jgi:multiple sugar transport system substrate-binding protein
MSTKKRRIAGGLAAALAGALALAGCSGGSSSSGDDQGSELTIWHMESVPTRVEAWNKLADKYNATDPEYPVKMQVQEWDSVYQSIAAAAQSQTQPDVLFAIPDFATYVRNLGLGQPVTDTVEELDEQYGFLDAATAAYTDDDEVWAVPLYGMVQMLWYNKDTLAAAGVEEPGTWNELLAAAEKLTADGKSGIAVPAGKNLASDQVLYSFMITGNAANWFNEDGSVNFDTPETVEALEFYNELLKFSPQDSASFAWGEPQALLNSGSAAMAVEKGQYLAPWEAESGLPPESLGCAPIPVKDDGGEPGSIYYSNAAMVLSDDAARQEGAADFLKWIMEEENYAEFLNADPGLFLPVTTDEAQAASWRSSDVIQTYSGCVDAMMEQSESGELFGFVDGQYIDRIGDISGQNILAQAVQKMYVNGETPADAAAWAQSAMEEAIE